MRRISEENIRPAQPLNRLLKIAVAAGVETAVRLHIKRGDDINGRDDSGQTPLMIAASRNRAAICHLLIEEGADLNLKDLSGNDALAIAKSAMASEAVAIIQDAIASFEKNSISVIFPNQEYLATNLSDQPYISTLDFSDDDYELLNFSRWEPELDPPIPENDLDLVQHAAEVHKLISDHTPIDLSEDWTDFEVFLPEKSFETSKLIDEDLRAQIQKLFLRAVREASVPESILEDISSNFSESDSKEIYSLIETIVNDLGAEIDTRLEIEPPLEVANETFDEADEVQAAMNLMDDIASHNNDSLRYFSRDVSRTSLLSADEEVFLGKEMESTSDGALNALAVWEGGVNKVIYYAKLVESGEVEVEWISSGKANDPIDFDDESIQREDDTDGSEIDSRLDDIDETKNNSLSPAVADFLNSVSDLQTLLSDTELLTAKKALIKSCLSKLALTRVFLMELASHKNLVIEGGDAAAIFVRYIKQHEQARNRMIISNLRLVMSVAKRYQSSRMLFEDLVQEGNLGLMKAVDRFDWRRGFKFSTYATWWIKQSILRGLADKGRTIRVPVHASDLMYKIAKEAEVIESRTGKYPSPDEIAVNLRVSHSKVLFLSKYINEPLSVEELRDDDIANIELVASPLPAPFVSVAFNNLSERLNYLLSELKTDQARILRLRYGLEDGHMYTLQEIGELMGVTRERIRQIESKALEKLSFPERCQHLLPFLDVDFSGVVERRFPEITSEKQ